MAQASQPFLPLTCIGNPILELHAEAPKELLDYYELQPNTAVQVEERHKHLLRDLLSSNRGLTKADYAIGGGAATVALAVVGLFRANEVGRLRNEEDDSYAISILGGVGRDELGQKLRELCHREAINSLFSDTDSVVTGWRAVLRTMQVTHGTGGLGPPPGAEPADLDYAVQTPAQVSTATFTGAAREYKLDHLRFKVWESIEATKIVYVDSIFLTVSSESVRIVAEHCAKMGKIFCLNLTATYLCSFFADRIVQLIPYTDYVFGNESEYMELARAHKEDVDPGFEAAATWLAKMPRADGNERRKRLVIATNGTRPCVVASLWRGFGVKIQRFPVPPVRHGRFVCKDGAGDAFSGGFLFGLMKEADLESCVQMALYAAQGSVQRTKPEFAFNNRPPISLQVKTDP